MQTTRLRVRLREVSPAVLRVLDVPSTSTLPELHLLLQAAVGWTNSHLHEFVTDHVRFGVPDDDWLDIDGSGCDPLRRRAETGVLLRELGPRFGYRYDLGDGWEHDVEVLGSGSDRPGCRYGEGDCPPEDCGGPGGYSSLRAVLGDPAHPKHGSCGPGRATGPSSTRRPPTSWSGRPRGRYRTACGWSCSSLPTASPSPRAAGCRGSSCGSVQQDRPDWAWSEKPASREEDLLPLLALHELLREVGLLRLSRGVLRPIKAAADERQVVRRLRSWFESDRFTELLAGLTVAALVSHGRCAPAELGQRVHQLLGFGWSTGRRPLTAADVNAEIAALSATLRGLDLITEHGMAAYGPGPAARTLLPGAALARLCAGSPATT